MPTKPTLKKGEATRQDLLAAARNVFGRVGFLGAETSLIAREAGKSIGVFYIYFENKEELLTYLVDDFEAELQGTLAAPLNPPDAIAEILTKLWTVYKRHASTFLALTEASATAPKFRAISMTLRDYARRDLINMIRERQSQGFCLATNADHAGEALEKMLNYCLYEWLAREPDHFGSAEDEASGLQTLVGIIKSVLEMDQTSQQT